MQDDLDIDVEIMVTKILPLYNGPFAKLRIKSSDVEYTVSKPLLCQESAYFKAMFEGEFSEDAEQIATLEPVEGVLSVRSVQCLLQWIYHKRYFVNKKQPAQEQISSAIELARLADMCMVSGLGLHLAQCIKDVLVANPDPDIGLMRNANKNVFALTGNHIRMAGCLPTGHAVRSMIASASVEGFLGRGNFKFASEAREYPTFASDLLFEVKKALVTMKWKSAEFLDPITRKTMSVNGVLLD
ncbi:hypothetical protein PDE_08963 [Penicillium oxalicum 114-2]|uniref:BTB domain-containing protein n=1 Tax=Penicillium oxalicum (strain 114-2 / CGMCC 5302) TaxID=933388 RepID=S7ZYW3_PENO1|nr:hypothetical protein PDE_08963 [Penicillium oxalicum 114-2]